jgi:predicted dehydrogenase/nucleoside-diphosphate-sugar epimerase
VTMISRSSTRPLRVAFVGTGQMARQHLAALRRTALPFTVTGVFDRAAGRAADFAAEAGAQAYASTDALFAGALPDVVHVCTPPSAHVEAALAAIEAGAHVYVEKPFALRTRDAVRLLERARERERLVCAGHQLLRDRAFEHLMVRAGTLGEIVQIDSHFAFRPVGPPSVRRGPRALADQAVDILPHPLYTLVHAMQAFASPSAGIEIAWADAGPSDLQAVLRAGTIVGRLSVSLRARPVASTLTIAGTRGSLTCDFVRSMVLGAGNSGTQALEKILNPMVEGAQTITGTTASVARRLRAGGGYPGLAELISDFYCAILDGGRPPLPAAHLVTVTELFEQLVARVNTAACGPLASGLRTPRESAAPLVVVTGARGFLGAHVAQALDRVRGIGRASRPDDLPVHEWIAADLSAGISPAALSGADVVIHAAAETAGGYEAHQRNTVDATRHLLHAMRAAGVHRLVLVSSLSVLRPPRAPWEQQDERTPRPDDPRPYGAYVWGKSQQEELVEREAESLGIETRVIRPGALIDWDEPELPGLMGRHLFGRWHLGLGRPALPIAVCDVAQCAEAIAWCATHFDDAPPIVNLFDPKLATRSAFLDRLRGQGWNGRMVWVPISFISAGLIAARGVISLLQGRIPARLAAWSILRPRRYDASLSVRVLEAAQMREHAASVLRA